MNTEDLEEFTKALEDRLDGRLRKIEERVEHLENLFVPKSGRGESVALPGRDLKPGRTLKCSPIEALPATTNCFGHVLSEEADGTRIPFNCTCGGSMWLCQPCALEIVRAAERDGTLVHLFSPDLS